MKSKTAKPIIAVDIDDVLAAENEGMRLFINETHGTKHTSKDYLIEAPYWGFWEQVWGVDEDEGHARHEAFVTSGVKASLKVLDGAIPTINWLKENYELVVVTSRDNRLVELTHEWLEKHFPQTFTNIEFVHVWDEDQKASKRIICKDIGASYLIDDNMEHCGDVAKENIQCLLCLLFGDYGWNKKANLPVGITRVKNWQQVRKFFENETHKQSV